MNCDICMPSEISADNVCVGCRALLQPMQEWFADYHGDNSWMFTEALLDDHSGPTIDQIRSFLAGARLPFDVVVKKGFWCRSGAIRRIDHNLFDFADVRNF